MITACLLRWKRLENIDVIVKHLRCSNIIDEIIVWNNGDAFESDECIVVNSLSNQICWGRYLAAFLASNDLIYFQDDDWLLSHDAISHLYGQYKRESQAVHNFWTKQVKDKNAWYSCVGFGAIFHKNRLSCFRQYFERHPLDYLFLREADKVFGLLNKKRNYLTTGYSSLPKLDVSLCTMAEHAPMREAILERMRGLRISMLPVL